VGGKGKGKRMNEKGEVGGDGREGKEKGDDF